MWTTLLEMQDVVVANIYCGLSQIIYYLNRSTGHVGLGRVLHFAYVLLTFFILHFI